MIYRERETGYPDVYPKPVLYAHRVMEYVPGKGASDGKLDQTFATCALEAAGLNIS